MTIVAVTMKENIGEEWKENTTTSGKKMSLPTAFRGKKEKKSVCGLILHLPSIFTCTSTHFANIHGYLFSPLV